MGNQYFNNLHDAFIARKYQDTIDAKMIVIGGGVYTLLFILLAILLHPEGKTLDYHFYSERGLVTAMSAIYLAMASAFSLGTIVVHIRTNVADIWPWVIMTVGFLFLALDETAQFHERLGVLIGDEVDSGMFRNWNDVIVILYGFIALPVVVVLMPSLLRYRVTIELFLLAFVFYVIHTLVDSTQDPSTTLSIIIEESAKLYCGAFLALSMFFSFLGALWKAELSGRN